MPRKIWMILIAIWFFLWGLIHVTNFKFEAENLIMGLIAVAIGVLYVFDK